MTEAWHDAVEAALGARPVRAAPLGGGCIGDLWRLDLAGGGTVVAKRGAGDFLLEAWMLGYLAENADVPVPAVLHAAPDLLLLEFLPGEAGLGAAAEAHAAEVLAALHGVTSPRYGLERDTVIGRLAQPNGPLDDWRAFFRDRRLLHAAGAARSAGRLPAALHRRIEALAGDLDRFIDRPAAPALIHGDLWHGNMLSAGGRLTGLLDPAIYYADPEIELAFGTLFGSLGDGFFRRYDELRGVRSGFFEARRDLYNLYPLLVHVWHFGGGYVGSVGRTLTGLGY